MVDSKTRESATIDTTKRLGAEGRWRWLFVALLLLVAAVMAVTARDYGITWDEEHHKVYGDLVLNWYSSFFHDREALTWSDVYLYGGFFDALAQLPTGLSGQGVYETRHVVNVLFGLLGVVAVYGVGSQLGGAAAGFFSAFFLVLTPVFYGHSFNNPKDVPFASLMMVAIYLLVRSYRQLPGLPWKQAMGLGAAVGLALGVRVQGVFIFGGVGLYFAAWLVTRWLPASPRPRQGLLVEIGRLALSFGIVLFTAWAVMLACWPWGQVSPIGNPWDALRRTAAYDWPLAVLYKGFTIRSDQLPPSFLPTWTAISLPEFYFVAFLAGAVSAFRYRSTWLKDPAHFRLAAGIFVLLFVAGFPMLTAIVLDSIVYDGIRQFLFAVPCLAVVAGVSVAAFFRSGILRPARLAVAAAVLLSTGVTVFDMAQLHPYEYVYLNRLVAGGFESGSQRFETDYWGASYREGIRWVIDNYRPQTSEQIRVANPNQRFLTAYYLEMSDDLRNRFKSVQDFENPHLYLSTTRWNRHKDVEGKVLHVVERRGVPLLYVIEVRQPS